MGLIEDLPTPGNRRPLTRTDHLVLRVELAQALLEVLETYSVSELAQEIMDRMIQGLLEPLCHPVPPPNPIVEKGFTMANILAVARSPDRPRGPRWLDVLIGHLAVADWNIKIRHAGWSTDTQHPEAPPKLVALAQRLLELDSWEPDIGSRGHYCAMVMLKLEYGQDQHDVAGLVYRRAQVMDDDAKSGPDWLPRLIDTVHADLAAPSPDTTAGASHAARCPTCSPRQVNRDTTEE